VVPFPGSNRQLQRRSRRQPPLFYQWQSNGTDLVGATSTNLILTNPQPLDSGSYSVIVTNSLGLIQSSLAILTVLDPLVITSQPASQSVPREPTPLSA